MSLPPALPTRSGQVALRGDRAGEPKTSIPRDPGSCRGGRRQPWGGPRSQEKPEIDHVPRDRTPPPTAPSGRIFTGILP
ncbi:MAG: hypothetical protein MH825_09085 [Cyanobacteria bacterium]|nr:hypothetical protein [Cyanobacteriota bacterium]